MSLPNSIIKMLDNQQINYNVTENMKVSQSESPCIVQSHILQDGKGKVQVLFPAGKLIDLEVLNQCFGRNLEGVPNSETHPLVEKHELRCVPAIPHWEGMPTFIDDSVLQADKLCLESGSAEQYLVMDQEGFSSICKNISSGNFAVTVKNTDADPEEDEKKILSSVKRFTQLRIKQRLDETLEIPPLPETAQKIIKLRADPDADISDLTNIVEIDPSLAAQVVSWAASPYYSAPGKIKSVHDAIVRVLGFDMVLNLALGLALGKSLSSNVINDLQRKEYWRSAVYTAATVEGLVTSIDRSHRPGYGMAYLSGLLHNFGYLVMAEVFPPYFSNINKLLTANTHLPQASSEMHLLGVSGNQIASWLLKNWNMPEEVVIALRQQNNLSYNSDSAIYAKLNFVAQQLLAEKGFGLFQAREVPAGFYDDLQLDIESANIAVENILDSGNDLDAIAEQMRA